MSVTHTGAQPNIRSMASIATAPPSVTHSRKARQPCVAPCKHPDGDKDLVGLSYYVPVAKLLQIWPFSQPRQNERPACDPDVMPVVLTNRR